MALGGSSSGARQGARTDARSGARSKPRLSLKGQALAALSRRDYSRLELRTKLLGDRRARRQADRDADDVVADPDDPSLADIGGPFADDPVVAREAADTPAPPPTEAEIDAVLDWLEAKGYLNDTRFVENRVQQRAARQGTLRIRQELSRHGLALSPEQAGQLRDTELARARDLWQRKFGQVGGDARERARQARFLAARGFAAEVVRRIVGGEHDED